MQKLAEMLTISDVHLLLENIHAGVALVARDGTLIAWNSTIEESKKQLADAANLKDYFPKENRKGLQGRLAGGMLERWLGEFSMRGPNPAVICDCMLIPIPNDRAIFIAERLGSESMLRGVIEKLNRQVKLFEIESSFTKKLAHDKQVELEAVVAQAQEVAQTDPLTFLYNRRAIVRELQDEVLRAERYGSMLSVSIIDVDHFKAINDTYGHQVGDEVLRQVAQRLRDGIRHPDIVGRYGGEEFIIVLPNSGAQAAGEQAARLCRQMSETDIQVREHTIRVTLSIGVAQLRKKEDSWDSLLKRADNAMYEAKQRGRACWVVSE
ncbi:MAG: hypothetical protein DPW18_19890 [Chloroflexi bacterium]|nr:hypothetical protein [Chloroflexota bacterium]MDL1942260.1 GGDEF domain-containing protein [Chloroflexi bacterium CFX2]